MAKNYNIKVSLTDQEIDLIKAMTKDKTYDAKSFHETMARMFYLQLREDMETLGEELGIKNE